MTNMGENDFINVAAIANERPEIGITTSSTPSGKRGVFYRQCVDKLLGYTEWYFPSQVNPEWNDEMEAQVRREYNQVQYEHEVLAEFGTEEQGVFNKDALDLATRQMLYAYDKLQPYQLRNLDANPQYFIFTDKQRAPYNVFRCVGVNLLITC